MNQVTDAEYNTAFKDEANRKIINSASHRYRRILGGDIESHKMCALWKALQTYNPDRGMRFTSWLYKCVKYKCYHEANKTQKLTENYNMATERYSSQFHDKSTFMSDMLMSLDAPDAKLISDRFLHNKTLSEISQEHGVSIQAIHQRLAKTLKKTEAVLKD